MNDLTHCPNCQQTMDTLDLERVTGGRVHVDLCVPCSAIWFDRAESMQLSPSAVIELFKTVHAHHDAARERLGSRMPCPRCDGALTFTKDICKTGPISYYRCLKGHGRLTPFFQFLREKQFVRTLSNVELDQVRIQIKQVMCSSCGAPVDLANESGCHYCGSPIAVLDADAVDKAMKIWSEAAVRRANPDAVAMSKALHQLDVHPLASRRSSSGRAGFTELSGATQGSDLLQLGIAALAGVLGAIAG